MDIGDEFVNDEMPELGNQYGISIKQTGAYSPWANGLNERNHATIDIMMEKMLEDLPNVNENTALQYAVSVGNCCLYSCSWIHTCSISHWTKIQSYSRLFMILYQRWKDPTTVPL